MPPQETVARLERLPGARFEHRLLAEKVADHLYRAALFLKSDTGFRALGKPGPLPCVSLLPDLPTRQLSMVKD